jgi:flavin-binding protein dodecin
MGATAKKERLMAVEKSIELTATGPSIDEAIAEAVHRASLTLKGISSFEVQRIEGVVSGDEITYRVLMRLTFALKERIHE